MKKILIWLAENVCELADFELDAISYSQRLYTLKFYNSRREKYVWVSFTREILGHAANGNEEVKKFILDEITNPKEKLML